jgi:hypothetical protein
MVSLNRRRFLRGSQKLAAVQHEMALLNGGIVSTRGSQNSVLLKAGCTAFGLGLGFYRPVRFCKCWLGFNLEQLP